MQVSSKAKKEKGEVIILKSLHARFRSRKLCRLIDGPIALLPCVSLYFYEHCENCDEGGCGLHDTMILVRDATLKILEKKTVADIASIGIGPVFK